MGGCCTLFLILAFVVLFSLELIYALENPKFTLIQDQLYTEVPQNDTYVMDFDENTVALELFNPDLNSTELAKYALVIFNGYEDGVRKFFPAIKCEEFYAK